MSYSVKEIFYTLQGEGANAGRPAVFCRFAGCNLWTGREQDRVQAVCQFCDTDFVGTNGQGGGRFATAADLAQIVRNCWPHTSSSLRPFVVCTGGEPLLQLDETLIVALHLEGFEIAVETNGTIPLPPAQLDWVCVSPKAGTTLKVTGGDELKLVFPQSGAGPAQFEHMTFQHFFLQPMDGLLRKRNTEETVQYCLSHPKWRLSLQTHKMIGIP